MSDMMNALHRFFSSLGISSYPAGQVPLGATLPLLTWEAAAGRFGNACAITATVWHDSVNANMLRAAFLDQVMAAIPEAGVKLPLPNGFLLMERGSDFLQLIHDSAHPGVLGSRIRLTLRRYGAT